MSQIYTCQFEDHDREAIIGYCLNQDCQLPPQCCGYCMQRKHSNHQDDCKGFKSLKKLLQQFISERTDLQKQLSSQLQQVKQTIDQLSKDQKADSDNLLQMDKMLSELNYQEFKNNIQFLKCQYSSSKFKAQTESERQKQLIIQFANLCEEQKKILQSFSYYKLDTFFNEGMELLKQDKQEEAIIKFNKALSYNSSNCDVICEKGRALFKLKKHNEAQQLIDRGLQINPNHSNLNLVKGNLLFKDKKQAILYIEKAIQLDPNNAQAYNSKGIIWAYSSKGCYLYDLYKYEEAIICYDKAIELDPNLAQAYSRKGYCLINLNKFEEAIIFLDKAIQLDPNLTPAYINKGASLYYLKQYEESIIFLDKAIQLDPNLAEAYIYKGIIIYKPNKGMALEKLNLYKRAIECYTLGIQKGYQPNKPIQEKIKKLQNI